MSGLLYPVQEGWELCPGGGATSSGECCLAQLGLSPAGKKAAPKGAVAPVTCLALQMKGGKQSLGAGRVCVLHILAQVGEGGSLPLPSPHLLPHKKTIPTSLHACFGRLEK